MFKKSKSKIKNRTEKARKLITLEDPKSPVSEQFRTLRTNISFSTPGSQLQKLLVTSSVQQEGKSTVSANLACVFAQNNTKVLFIDADMRKPTVHNTFGVKNAVGLSTYLTEQSTLKQTIQPTEVENLDIMSAGPVPPNPSELLNSKNLDIMLDELCTYYDLIIFDSPPVLSVTDSQIISAKVDGIVLVIDKQENNKSNVKEARDLLTVSENSKLLGIVFNNDEYDTDKYYVYQ